MFERLTVALAAVWMLAAVPFASADEDSYLFGDIVEIAPNARLVIGQPLNALIKQPDIANCLMYKAGTTLVVVDTGATASFIPLLNRAAEQLRPFEAALLINTHLHVDHVGNNGWIETLGVPTRHYISAHDLIPMRDQVAYFTNKFEAASPYLPGLPPAKEFAAALLSWFGKINADTKSLASLESLPLEEIKIGSTIWNGWRFLNGKVAVLQTGGHTDGHVAVFLPELKLLDLADETTGYYTAYGGTPAWQLMTLERAAEAFREGSVDTLVDGHTFAVLRGEIATKKLDEMVRDALAYNAAAVRILNEHSEGIAIVDLATAVDKAPEIANVSSGANSLPLYSIMQMLNKLRELGVPLPEKPADRVAFPR
jgi:glyoxylase-like metal-dependent hydrolase (beta-lactamase superfamily II)